MIQKDIKELFAVKKQLHQTEEIDDEGTSILI